MHSLVHRSPSFRVLAVLGALLPTIVVAASCSKENTVNQNNATNYTSVTQTVLTGADTTLVHPEGANLFFPAGAVSTDTQVTVSNVPPSEAPPLPAGATLLGQLFLLEPAGLSFGNPVTLQINTGSKPATIHRAPAGGGWQAVGGSQSGLYVQTTITGFSHYAALASGGGTDGGTAGPVRFVSDNECSWCAIDGGGPCYQEFLDCNQSPSCSQCNQDMTKPGCTSDAVFSLLVECACSTCLGPCAAECEAASGLGF
ncbi:MAG: hypothetical protein KF718_12785 [Polyangiaceae bacterium]|nr:hypothetical protein [Polyangiaceae bacterium]